MNKVLLVGRIVRDPEVNQTSSGIKYTRITIAINRPYGKDQVDFVPVVAWRQSAEFLGKYCHQGDLISVDGSFQSSTYEKDGQKITKYEVSADRVQIVSSKNSSSNTANTSGSKKTTFANDKTNSSKTNKEEVPWELDL